MNAFRKHTGYLTKCGIMLAYDSKVRVCIELKPNEPIDHTYIPTTGHAIALGLLCSDSTSVSVNIKSAQAILAGLDPSDKMGFALTFNNHLANIVLSAAGEPTIMIS